MTLNVHSPISDRVGPGLSIVNDEIGNGTRQETYLDGIFSYTIPLSREKKLSIGIKAGNHLLNIDFNKLANYNQEVVGAGLGNITKTSPRILAQASITKPILFMPASRHPTF